MPQLFHSPRNIAIVGSGIAGLGAAYCLAPHHRITLYEKSSYLGGHSRTVDVPVPEGTVPVDTGFIVFNDRNYPLLTALFSHLEVPVVPTSMSFGVSIADGWLEYGTPKLRNLFAQASNLFHPLFLGMLKDILTFHRRALAYASSDPSVTLGQCLDELKMGAWFRHYYLLAMGAAIWSTPVARMLDFPASNFVRFFHHHGLLTVDDQPQWKTVQGGSREYVSRLSASLADRVRLGCGVQRVVRDAEGATVHDSGGGRDSYDAVIFACHADEALGLIEGPTHEERMVLSSFSYQPNRMVLHSDTSFMPKRRAAWASWVYMSEGLRDCGSHVSLSYWMNHLQPLQTKTPMIVTLNPAREPKDGTLHDVHGFRHPVFDAAAIRAQSRIQAIQGKDRFWFCGAYQRHGFHEDGLWSAVRVAESMGVTPPWI